VAVPIVAFLLAAAAVGVFCYWATRMPWVGGGCGVVAFLLLQAGGAPVYRMHHMRQATWQQRQRDLQQQEGLVRQFGMRELCPWWARVLAWCTLTPLFMVSGVLAVTFGQLFILWKQPREKRVWLRACVSFEPLFWLCIVWAMVRMAVGVDPPAGVNPVLAAAIATATAMRGTLKLLFDVEEKFDITLWGRACRQQALEECSAGVLRLFGLVVHVVAGGAWVLVVCRFGQTPWQLAAHLQPMVGNERHDDSVGFGMHTTVVLHLCLPAVIVPELCDVCMAVIDPQMGRVGKSFRC